MAIRKSIKTTTPPAPLTLEERRNGAHATAGAALSVFQRAAEDLENAAADLEGVEHEASVEAARLTDLANQANQDASNYYRQADNIRALLAGN